MSGHSMRDAAFDAVSTREAFGEALLGMADRYDNLLYVSADTLKSVGGGPMSQKYPDRALNIGIAEQGAALMGAGMAACGAKVFVTTYATFASMRMCEQIRTFICYPDLDVKIVAGLGGLSGGQEGPTHQGIEDVGVLRSIANLVIVAAADAASTGPITRAITEYEGPVYLRLGREKGPTVFDDSYRFAIGKANVMKPDGDDAVIIASGAAVARAAAAERILRERGHGVRLLEMPCIKPLDVDSVVKAARETGLVVTAEDHNVMGGLGSAVAEALAENCSARLVRIGIGDCYTQTGDMEELLDRYNLHPEHIAKTVADAIQAK